MKGLTIYQPWASLECLGIKGFETRSKPTSYRGLIAIHSAKQYPASRRAVAAEINNWLERRGGLPLPAELPLGAILGIAVLTDCIKITESNWTTFGETETRLGLIRPGRYLWALDSVKALKKPIHCGGAQGLWSVSPELESSLLDKLLGKRSL